MDKVLVVKCKLHWKVNVDEDVTPADLLPQLEKYLNASGFGIDVKKLKLVEVVG